MYVPVGSNRPLRGGLVKLTKRKKEDYGGHNTALNRGGDSGLTLFLPLSVSSFPDRRRVHDGPSLTVRVLIRSSFCWSTVVLDCSSL
jgi:hypothetical protein